MSPAKRTDKKRRRAWAAPFILTTVLAGPGCTVKEGPPPSQPAPKGVTTDHRGDGSTHEAPPTDPNATPAPNTDSTPPTVIANPPPPAANALPDAPTEGGEVIARKDGTCWFHYDAPPCPPKATCNPPPPRQVKCQ
jgi:hypothetical protein